MVRDVSPSLTRRAALTARGTALRQAARLIVALAVTPIVLRDVGASSYGYWLMVQQVVALVALSDLRTGSTLKFTLATAGRQIDDDARRRQVGAALLAWRGVFPLIVGCGLVAVLLAPILADESIADSTARWVMALSLLTVVLDRILSLPTHVLRGVNEDYRAAGVDTIVILLTGVVGIFAVAMGYGIVGLAVVGLGGMVVANGLRLLVTRRALPWFGAARPNEDEIRMFGRIGGWLVVGDIAFVLLLGMELVIVGLVLGPEIATVYGATQWIVRAAGPVMAELFSSHGPGVAAVAGRGDTELVRAVRDRSTRLVTLIVAIVSCVVVAINEVFVERWAGADLYGGLRLDVLFVLAAAATVYFRLDSVILDTTLKFRQRSVAMLVCGVATVALGLPAARIWGPNGLAVVALVCRTAMFALGPWLLERSLERSPLDTARSDTRPVASVLLSVAACTALRAVWNDNTVMAAVARGTMAVAIAFVSWWFVGLKKDSRWAFAERLRRVGRFAA